MPITNNTSDLFRDQLAGGAVLDAAKAHGRLFTATGTLTNLATDLSGSTWKMVDVPSGAIPDERTAFDVENWGFAAIRIGTLTDVDALVSQTQVTENIVTPLAFGDANHGKAFWELLGLTEDPGNHLSLYAHAIADATGAGSMPFRVSWLF